MQTRRWAMVAFIFAAFSGFGCDDEDNKKKGGGSDAGDDASVSMATDTSVASTGDTSTPTGPTQLTGDPCSAASPWDCNPVTNEGCIGEEACSWGIDVDNLWGFFCYGDSVAAKGEACDDATYCGPKLTCTEDDEAGTVKTCKTVCCSDADCDAAAQETCVPFTADDIDSSEFLTVGTFGVCII